MLQTSRQGGNRHRCRRDARTQASSLKNEMLFHVVYFTLRDFFEFLFIFITMQNGSESTFLLLGPGCAWRGELLCAASASGAGCDGLPRRDSRFAG